MEFAFLIIKMIQILSKNFNQNKFTVSKIVLFVVFYLLLFQKNVKSIKKLKICIILVD